MGSVLIHGPHKVGPLNGEAPCQHPIKVAPCSMAFPHDSLLAGVRQARQPGVGWTTAAASVIRHSGVGFGSLAAVQARLMP